MTARHRFALLALFAVFLGTITAQAQQLGPDVVVMDIKVGKDKELKRVVIGLYDDAAPQHAANFKELARTKFYRGMQFHRAFPGSLVQTGDPYSKRGPNDRTGTGGPGWTIPAEIRLPHVKGSVAMSRLDNKINPARVSNGSQFYVTLKPVPALNGEYTVFGRVLEGLEYLEQISRTRTDRNNFPLEKVIIKRIVIEPRVAS
jgi:cyclophilin family peptidyl-prolyl cis-trans isomerase